MSRKLMAMLLSSALVFGSVSTSAWSAGTANPAQAASAVNNQSPLPPGRAAGIKEAQDIEHSALLGIGIVVVIVAVAWLLLDNDDDEGSAPTTGT